MAKTASKATTLRTKSAFADESFYHQLRNGGERGWNDIHVDPADAETGKERFYIRYYGALICSIELAEKDGEKQTKITVFGSSDKAPVPSERQIDPEEWKKLFEEVMEAVQALYQL